jgi:pyridoxine kinase
LTHCDAVLSGYQGGGDVGAVLLDAVELVKRRNPAAIYCCDPVMGDVGRGFFVRPGIPQLMRDRVVPAAQIVTPNQFELEFLTGRSTETLEGLLAAAHLLRRTGPDIVLVTSAVHAATAPDMLEMIAVNAAGAWAVSTPRLPQVFTGAGDLTAATFLAHVLRSADLADALAQTAAIVYGVLKATADSGEAELQLVAAQQQIVCPSMQFDVRQLS